MWKKSVKILEGEVRSRKSKERQHNGQKIPKGKSEAVNHRKDNTMVKRYQRGSQKP